MQRAKLADAELVVQFFGSRVFATLDVVVKFTACYSSMIKMLNVRSSVFMITVSIMIESITEQHRIHGPYCRHGLLNNFSNQHTHTLSIMFLRIIYWQSLFIMGVCNICFFLTYKSVPVAFSLLSGLSDIAVKKL